MWIRRKVQKGTQTGQMIGYPTLNFHVGYFGAYYTEGVYSCDIRIAGKEYHGALFFGSRLSTKKKTLEIHVIGLNQSIYGSFVRFRVMKKIRSPKKIANPQVLKGQIAKDIALIQASFL